ncbi:MAG: PadR family transcriptional regulator [Anaerolineaceae bacterium]|nr:PadR family transcriptional regulator [Anaerolineaceae bacterium]
MDTFKPASNLYPEFLLLGLLFEQPGHGYDLHQRLSEEFGQFWHISRSQTYNILKRLERQKDISGVEEEQGNRPARRRFRLTEAGQGRFNDWLRSTVGSSTRSIRLEFLARLYFIERYSPELMLSLLGRQMNEIRDRLSALEQEQRSLPVDQVYNQLSSQLRIQQLTLVLGWLGECRDSWYRFRSFKPLIEA